MLILCCKSQELLTKHKTDVTALTDLNRSTFKRAQQSCKGMPPLTAHYNWFPASSVIPLGCCSGLMLRSMVTTMVCSIH